MNSDSFIKMNRIKEIMRLAIPDDSKLYEKKRVKEIMRLSILDDSKLYWINLK